MVALGLTALVVPVTVPTPLSMLSDVAPDTVQPSVLLWPTVMVEGVAMKLEMVGGCGAGFTVTVAVAVTLPTAFVAVRV